MQRHLLQSGQNTVEFLCYGAHIVSWRVQGQEQLFVSSKAQFQPGMAIRGGIPVIFPQFSTRGHLPRHGFARTQTWQLQALEPQRARLRLSENANTLKLFPFAFDVDFEIELRDDELRLRLTVSNNSDDVFDFTSALHSYLAVSDLENVRVSGIGDCSYEDALTKKRRISSGDDVHFDREIDRIYQCHQTQLHDGSATLYLSGDGFDDTVIWNPHASGAAVINDLGNEEWRRFVCIEAANVQTRIVLPPGASNTATHTLRRHR